MARNPHPRLSVVLLSFNSADTLPALLGSIDAQRVTPDEILLLDNASRDASPHLLAAWSETRETSVVHAFERNIGYAAAMNWGIRHTTGDIVCLLNADLELDRDFLAEGSDAFSAGEQIGMVTGAIYRLARGERTTTIDSLGVAISEQRVMHDIGSEVRAGEMLDVETAPFGVSGCAPLYRRAMLDAVALDAVAAGGEVFREMFESYYEDVDLAWRARLRGWEAVCTGRARAWHVREGSLTPRYRRIARRRAFRNRLWTMFLNERASIWLRHLPRWLPHEMFQLAKMIVQPGLVLAWLAAWAALPRLLPLRRRNRREVVLTPEAERALFTKGDGSLLRRIRRKLRLEVTS